MMTRTARALIALLAVASSACAVAAPAPAPRWRAHWIWQAGARNERNIYVVARKTFTLDRVPAAAPARITADSRYQLAVNGVLVGRGPVRYDPAWVYYDRYDIARFLRRGRNAIAVLVFHHDATFQHVFAPAGLLFEAQVGALLVASDRTWTVRRETAYRQDLPKMGLQLASPEEYDARRAPAAWGSADPGASRWEPAEDCGPAIKSPGMHLIPRDIPALRETLVAPVRVIRRDSVKAPPEVAALPTWDRMAREPLAPQPGAPAPIRAGEALHAVLTPGRDASFTLDFGREMIGYPRLVLRASAPGAVVDMGYSELLESDRAVPNRHNVHYADRYICRAGSQTYEVFTPRAFRYMQLDLRAPAGTPCTVTIERVAHRYTTYPVWNRGAFECSDPTLNAVWKLGRHTAQQCMEDAYTDCPWRERGQWWGDARAEAFTTYYAFGDARLIRKAILQIGQGQRADGITPGVWPADFDNRWLPDFCLIWAMTTDDYARFTGDRAFARAMYPKVARALRWFDRFRDARGLLRDVPHWVFIDWAPVDKSGACTALNAFHVGALQAAQRLAVRAGLPNDAADWRGRADAAASAMRAHLWSEREGAFADALHNDGALSDVISEQANALCVLYGITPPERTAGVFARIAPAQSRPTVRCGSPYFSFYLLWAMHHAGLHTEAVAYARDRWKVMLDAGATTAWEVWGQGASLCHGWSSGPTSLLPAWVLGVRPTADGMSGVTIAPQTAGLTWALGQVPTPRGPVHVSWRVRGSRFTLVASVPTGVVADVTLPAEFGEPDVIAGHAAARRKVAGVTHLALRGGRIWLQAGRASRR